MSIKSNNNPAKVGIGSTHVMVGNSNRYKRLLLLRNNEEDNTRTN